MGNTQLWVPVEPKPFDRSTWNLTWVITSAVWPHTPKKCENRPRRAAPAYGWNIVFKCFFNLFYILLLTSCAALENTFLGVSPPFLCQTTWFGEDWFPRGSQLQHQNFSPHKPPKTSNFGPVFGLGKFSVQWPWNMPKVIDSCIT